MSKLHIKKGDMVYVNAGDDKGKTGRVLSVDTSKKRAFVEGVNMVSKSTKPNANNPTGGIVTEEQFRAVLEKIKDQNTLLVIDEAYFEYSEITNVELLKEYDNIFIIRTMSKVMGLAGARVGYGISSPKVIEYMHRVKPVFSLTKLSYIAAITTMEDKKFIAESIKNGIESREFLYNEINKMESVHIYPSKSNYLLIDIHNSGFTAAELTKEFMKRGVIVRDCTSFKGLDEYYIRISICTLEEDAKFIEIMKEILNE